MPQPDTATTTLALVEALASITSSLRSRGLDVRLAVCTNAMGGAVAEHLHAMGAPVLPFVRLAGHPEARELWREPMGCCLPTADAPRLQSLPAAQALSIARGMTA